MCGRLNLHDNPAVEALFRSLGINIYPGIAWEHNVAPSARILAIHKLPDLKASSMIWGFKEDWSSSPIINARSESIFTKPTFKDAIRISRCVIPVSGFYEWRRPEKIPFYFTSDNGEPLLFAGIYKEKPAIGLSCCIVTTAANEIMAPVHHRMPVLLQRDKVMDWITQNDESELASQMASQKTDWLKSWRVGQYVNNAKNQGSRCIEAAD